MSKKRNIPVHNMEAMEDFRTGASKKKFHIKDLRDVRAKTYAQEEVFHVWNENKNLFLEGSAGTGKTFLALYLALREVLEAGNQYNKVVIVRSVVPTRDMGFLPGTIEEKSEVYELPYVSICNELFEYSKSYENLKKNHYIDFTTTSFIRGITIKNAIVIVDESQNCTFDELSSVMTRVGDDTKIIFCGDTNQTDLTKKSNDVSGFRDFRRIMDRMNEFGIVTFFPSDIVRSGLVRSFLIAKEELAI